MKNANLGARKIAALLLTTVSLTNLSCSQTATKMSATAPEDAVQVLKNEIPGMLKDARVPGAAVAVIDDGKIVFESGFGLADVESKRVVDGNTIFNIASISKPVTAWGIMKLVEEGKLDLDRPVESYLKRWKIGDSGFDSSGVTLRRLLSHTAGLNMPSIPGFPPGTELPSLEQNLRGEYTGSIYAKPGTGVKIVKKPGEEFAYSGGGFVLMQLLIEEVTGKRFDEYMREEVLLPLGMDSSRYGFFDSPHNATPYTRSGNRERIFRFTGTAGAGIYATAGDLARFVTANTYKTNTNLLKPETIRLMHKRIVDIPPGNGPIDGFALGFGVGRTGTLRLISHSGGNAGWRCIFVAEPESGKGIVALTNSDNGDRLLKQLLCRWSSIEFGRTPKGCEE